LLLEFGGDFHILPPLHKLEMSFVNMAPTFIFSRLEDMVFFFILDEASLPEPMLPSRLIIVDLFAKSCLRLRT
jgi:hypothetical protein